jgi:thiamine pyrophosphate-dependent acetolactate synthase large subunit-like protein
MVLVWAGRDAIDEQSRAALLRLAERIESPLAITLRAKGLFQEEDYNLRTMGTLSSPAVVDIITKSDCILAFGSGLNFHTTFHGGFVDVKRVVQVAATAGSLGRGHTPDVGLIGSIPETVDKMIYWLDEAEIPSSGFRKAMTARGVAAMPDPRHPSESFHLDYIEVLSHLNRTLPADRVLVTDAGCHMIKVIQYLGVESPQLYVQTASFGSIGLGLP